jgi:hypothetical protein
MWIALIGFFVPIFWGVAGFILFNLREGLLSRIFWGLVYFTCPFWSLPADLIFTILTPFLNAALYGGLALLFFYVRNAAGGAPLTKP